MWRNYMYTRRMQHKLSKMGVYLLNCKFCAYKISKNDKNGRVCPVCDKNVVTSQKNRPLKV